MFMQNLPSSKPSSLQIRVTRGPKLQSGTPIISGFLLAGTIIPNNYKIPYRDSNKKTGYQRQPQAARVNELAMDLRKKRVDLPTAVLLNIRDRAAVKAVRDDEGGAILDLQQLVNEAGQPGADFYVVDGQHRVLALEKLMQEEPNKWDSFALPFVCMLGADEHEEMDQFYIVNSKAKSVRTDLAFALLKERAGRDEEVYESLVERGREWQVDGQTLLERLAESSSLWKHRIRQPGMDKGDTTISSAGFVNSLKPLLQDSPAFKRFSVDQRLKVLEAFWHGIRDVAREPFDEPSDYSLQKGVGVLAMHELLPDVLEILRARGASLIEPSGYTEVMANVLNNLEGENVSGESVKGVDFWKAAPEGAAGSYSSSAGKRVLTAKLKQHLPEIPLE